MTAEDVKKVLPIFFKSGVVPYLVGESGVGKSQAVQAVAESLGLDLVCLFLGQNEEGDLIGLPRVREKDGVICTVYSRPEWFPYDYVLCEDCNHKIEATDREDLDGTPCPKCNKPMKFVKTKGIIFLDEFNRAATVGVLQAMFQFVIGEKDKDGNIRRRLHTHVLPKDWYVVAAGNPETSDYVVQSLDKALLGRVCQLIVEKDHKAVVNWMHKNIKNKVLTDFVAMTDKALGPPDKINLVVNPMARSYELLDRVLTYMDEKDFNKFGYEVIQGFIGDNLANMLYTYIKDNFIKPIDLKELFALKDASEFDEFYEKRLKRIINHNDEQRVELLEVTLSQAKAWLDEKEFSEKECELFSMFLHHVPVDLRLNFCRSLDLNKDYENNPADKFQRYRSKHPKFEADIREEIQATGELVDKETGEPLDVKEVVDELYNAIVAIAIEENIVDLLNIPKEDVERVQKMDIKIVREDQ